MKRDAKKKLIGSFARHAKDTGSSVVQIAIVSERIKQLTEHLKIHKKDDHSRRGLFKLVGKRRKLLNYLESTNTEEFKKVIEEMGIRTGTTV